MRLHATRICISALLLCLTLLTAYSYEGNQLICPRLLKEVKIDGKWTNSDEWSDAATVTLVQAPGSSQNATAYLYTKHDSSSFYFLVDFISATSLALDIEGACIHLDPLHNGGKQVDDREFCSDEGGEMWIYYGGESHRQKLPQGAETSISMAGSVRTTQPHQISEFRIPFSVFRELHDNVGLLATAFAGGWAGTPDFRLASWPEGFRFDTPLWGDLMLSPNPVQLETTTVTDVLRTLTSHMQSASFVTASVIGTETGASSPVEVQAHVTGGAVVPIPGGYSLLLFTIVLLVPTAYLARRRIRKLRSSADIQAVLKRSSGSYAQYLAKLEDLKSSGIVNERVYRKLREEYEEKLR